MKQSPIQLLESFPEKMLVERVGSDDAADTAFEKIDLQIMRGIESAPHFWEQEPPFPELKDRTYQVTLGVRTPKDVPAGPYAFEFVLTGIFACVGDVKGKRPEEMVFEYGLTILYGNIREQFAAMSSRMSPGVRFLPTLSFLGEPLPRKQRKLASGTAPAVDIKASED